MSDLITHFGIDWKLLAAQAVNFFVLLAVLKKFAFGPIMAMLRTRREEIEKGIAMKNEAEENLQKIDILREETLKNAREQAVGIVDQAQETAHARREEILQEATRKSEAVVMEAKRIIREEKEKMIDEFIDNAGDLLRLGVVKILGKIPAKGRDEKLLQEALRELKAVSK